MADEQVKQDQTIPDQTGQDKYDPNELERLARETANKQGNENEARREQWLKNKKLAMPVLMNSDYNKDQADRCTGRQGSNSSFFNRFRTKKGEVIVLDNPEGYSGQYGVFPIEETDSEGNPTGKETARLTLTLLDVVLPVEVLDLIFSDGPAKAKSLSADQMAAILAAANEHNDSE